MAKTVEGEVLISNIKFSHQASKCRVKIWQRWFLWIVKTTPCCKFVNSIGFFPLRPRDKNQKMKWEGKRRWCRKLKIRIIILIGAFTKTETPNFLHVWCARCHQPTWQQFQICYVYAIDTIFCLFMTRQMSKVILRWGHPNTCTRTHIVTNVSTANKMWEKSEHRRQQKCEKEMKNTWVK